MNTEQRDSLLEAYGELQQRLAEQQARAERAEAALAALWGEIVRPVPEGVATELGYECLICGWEVDRISPDVHEPSCILADESLAALAAAEQPPAAGQGGA